MTWQRTLDIGAAGARIAVVGTYVELDVPAGDRLTPADAAVLAGVLKQAARFAEREQDLAGAGKRRRSA